tara:strand:+ start:6938 stop:7057 length:120 start_codon:yes stop_codon:yes gene_type:complete
MPYGTGTYGNKIGRPKKKPMQGMKPKKNGSMTKKKPKKK